MTGNVGSMGRYSDGRTARAMLVVLAILGCFVVWGWLRSREMARLAELPDAERRQLYARTVENLATVCAAPDARRIESFCMEQATVAVSLPECDARCERLARAHLANPVR
jgi:hypothetical protein